MILLAEGGSTKCHWAVLDKDRKVVLQTRTEGLNPTNLSVKEMEERLSENPSLANFKNRLKHLYFYGAGCGASEPNTKIEQFLKRYFAVEHCEVSTDLHAACYAVTQEPGMVCILGTGSNAAYYDGKTIRIDIPALGYSVMDEASANYFGKELIRSYFYQRMPEKIQEDFSKTYDLSPSAIRKNLYDTENPNVYLAHFARFIFQKDYASTYFKQLLVKGIDEFIENRILTYPESAQVPIHFVGSIAFYSEAIIAGRLAHFGLKMGKIIRHPIDSLIKNFQDGVFPKRT